MEQPLLSTNTRAGTIGGTLLVLLFKINISDLLTSAILAAVGATVSFGVSILLRWAWRRARRK